jgi:hypothetical protein
MILALATVIKDDSYLSMSRNEFIAAIMKSTGGSQNPQSISEWYDRLMTDAFGPAPERPIKPHW